MLNVIDGRAGPGPVSGKQRIESIDILRGLALFGVLYINLIREFRVDIFRQFIPTSPAPYLIDRWIDTYIPTFVELKAFALFSFLFGIGLAIQMERIQERGGPVAVLLARRLASLFVLGIIHLTLIWNGDILSEYALAGFIALPFLFLPLRWLGIAAVLFIMRYIAPWPPYPISLPSQDWLQAHVTAAAIVLRHGSFQQVVRFEWRELTSILPLHVFMMPRTIALFLLGAFCWRTDIFKHLHEKRHVLLASALIGVGIGGTLTVLTSSPFPPILLGKAEDTSAAIGELSLTMGYAGTILYATTTGLGVKILGWAAPVGRMAFTNYILQSAIFSFLFFGWGLGLYGLRPLHTLLIGVCTYVLQVIGSACWLRYFRFGPIEWLWRSMMYGISQPMRIQRLI